jgi:integrase/recombinase XerD
MKTTIKLIEAHRIKENGLVALILYISIDGQRTRLPLNIEYAPGRINPQTNELLKSLKKDENTKDASDYNIIIRREIAKVNEIIKTARLAGKKIDIDQLKKEYQNFENREDFLVFMEGKIIERFKRKKITDGTRKTHNRCLNWLKIYKPKIQFAEIDKRFIERFEYFMSKQNNRRSKEIKKLDSNTVSSTMKYFKAYITLAINDGVVIVNPFLNSDVKTTENETIRKHLMPSEVAFLMQHFEADNDMPLSYRIGLCRFLIACTLSLRISDIMKLNWLEVEKLKHTKRMAFFPTKQIKNNKQKTLYLPIDTTAMFYLTTLVELLEQAESVNLNVTESYGRRLLNKISEKVKSNIGSFHVGRHTFATNFLRAGGKLHHLQQILGHGDIKTTMRYVHIVETETETQLLNLSIFYQSFRTDNKNDHTQHTPTN